MSIIGVTEEIYYLKFRHLGIYITIIFTSPHTKHLDKMSVNNKLLIRHSVVLRQ
ncbi:hypothetical protein NT01EI_3053 [Edwardsiella ictaluri 93-146]|uniref:Uncharacterized protein n=1 Tax=Edwardsiella ictaluri (strain 93-146) TaxID=634503 RepID=C5BAJ8_EDWI9|nr:hypothetical protein NT01EI_3053 [Edwardsiella ictaluri 93-146]